jgi:ATP-binding cassette subfamily B protein/subfamily B ATP-binding cassette protein MsbA
MELASQDSAVRSTLQKYLRIIRYALTHWPALASVVALTAVLANLAALQPWPLKIVVDYGLGGSEPAEPFLSWLGALGIVPSTMNLIWIAGLAIILLYAVTTPLNAARTWIWSAIGQRIIYALAGDLFLQMQRLSPLFHATRTVGDSLSRITSDTWCVFTVTQGILIAPVQHLFTLVAVGALAWQLDPELTMVMLAIAPVLALAARYFGQRLKKFEREKLQAKARIVAFLHQILGAMRMIQAADAGARNLRAFHEVAADAVRANQRSALIASSYDLITGVFMTFGTALVLYVGGYRVLGGGLSVGSLLVFLAYVKTLEGASRGLLDTYASLRTVEASIDRVLEILDAKEVVRDAPDARPLPPRREGEGGHLVFRDVTFGYEPDQPVLKGISLEVEPGETVALVGTTGAGKSTLVSLVPRFFDPWTGEVLLDGIELRKIRLASLRSETSIVLQDPFLLPLSIADNIGYGRAGASREDIVAAAVAANAHEFIIKLPEGYDAVLGGQGATLSGGQRQRLAIARALLKDALVLILDEPTSALDSGTEQLVMDALERLMRGRTTLIIAHRLSTVRRAHRIVVLEDGRIVEIGSYDDLVARGGRFARLHRLQMLEPKHEGECG